MKGHKVIFYVLNETFDPNVALLFVEEIVAQVCLENRDLTTCNSVHFTLVDDEH